ncbi:winged helix-turn-helix domain-containing protein [Duganella sp. sic0402]|uniref:winged helix-turn-helix domain-containing protein n=1 Tax=Duganella sp. sic0402 TaxID=2854786 RepID=UPI001C4585D8|nr:winged helix-turn-helix domain-containing protein [Duganella sp. sic0402]MBV7536132.1 winged helix-turn-helix domain-containing protein [Duganella sp. sic0402]
MSLRDDHSATFGRYQIFPELRVLLRDGDKIDLGPRAFDVLWMLVEANGALVSKDELIARVWGGVIVEENNLQAQMSAIRKALGTDRDMISTEFGKGYALSAPRQERAAALDFPHPVTSLVGRADELNDIQRLIAERRFVTLTGPGGIGKTRLAIEAGHQLRATFPDGVYMAEMAKIAEPELVPAAIEACLQLSPAQLRNKRLLLIIDNGEHLAEPIAGQVEALLNTAPSMHILVTAQEPLDAAGEHVYRLAPLAVPPADTHTAEQALAHAAVRLFVERVSASVHQFVLDDVVAGDVSAICRQLDGMPLALELAAARVPVLGIGGVLAGLNDRFKLLTAGRRTALPRQRTLRATVDWSHNLLDEEERRLFRRLSVFAAGFTADAARHVGAPEHGETWDTIDVLSSLAAKSLLQPELNGPLPRYRFLETIRVYAMEKLADSGEVAATAQRHAAFFTQLARQASDDWRLSYQADIDDIRAALDWAFSSDGDEQTGIDILTHSAPFWNQLSLHGECQRWLTLVLNGEGPAIAPRQEMALQASYGTSLAWARGPVDETLKAWTRALDLAHQLSDLETQLQAYYGLWLYKLRCERYVESLAHANQLADLAAGAGDQEAFVVGQRLAGVSQLFLGQHDEARRQIEASLRWYEQGRPTQLSRFGMDQHAAALAYFARVLWFQGHTSDALEAAEAAVERARDIDHACSLCCALAEGWCLVHALNNDDEAVEQAAATLIRTAAKHGLGVWENYGDTFERWVAAKRSGAQDAAAMLERLIHSGAPPGLNG